MAHFAELDDNNRVLRVIVIANEDTSDNNGVESESIGISFCQRMYGADTKWKQTSINASFRKRYAGTNMLYNEELDAFMSDSPYPSWILDTETAGWEPPIPCPELTEEQEESESYYEWNEENQTWEFIDNA